ncbi:MAG: hypothetical protein J6Q38_02785 [Clostridia bacterium]|nr:hypothetical protein [Clostridia bacterium]
MVTDKSLKDYAKEAKHRLKNSFWKDYKSKIDSEISVALAEGVSVSKVKKYYQNKATVTIRGVKDEDEAFYIKVKDLLKTYGEVSDAIGRLTDKEYFETLSYEQKQRYTLEISNKYVKAKERYYKELQFEKTV